jgi:hypothetical protein
MIYCNIFSTYFYTFRTRTFSVSALSLVLTAAASDTVSDKMQNRSIYTYAVKWDKLEEKAKRRFVIILVDKPRHTSWLKII